MFLVDGVEICQTILLLYRLPRIWQKISTYIEITYCHLLPYISYIAFLFLTSISISIWIYVYVYITLKKILTKVRCYLLNSIWFIFFKIFFIIFKYQLISNDSFIKNFPTEFFIFTCEIHEWSHGKSIWFRKHWVILGKIYLGISSIIQNVNLHLDLHILRNVRNDRVVSIDLKKKKKKDLYHHGIIILTSAWNFLSFFIFSLFIFILDRNF